MSLKKNTAWNVVGTAAPMLLGLATIPYLLRQLGEERFGILSLVWALIGYFSVFDFGIGRALTQQVSSLRDSAAPLELSGVMRTGLVLVTALGLLGGVVLGLATPMLAQRWLNVAPALQDATTQALLISALGIPLTTLVTGLRGILEGYEDFRAANVLKVVLGCATFGLPALSVACFGPSLAHVVASLVLARLVILGGHLAALRPHVGRWWPSGRVGRQATRPLLKFGAWMTLSNLISPLMVTADRFVISNQLGGAAVAHYTVPFDFILRLLVLPAALTGALFPRFASLAATDPANFARTYRRGLLAIFAVMAPLCLVLALGSRTALGLWLGDDFAERAWAVGSVLSIGLLFNSLAQVPHAALQASAGGVRTTALLHLVEFAVYLPVLIFCLLSFGVVGAAVAWSLRVFADLAALLFFAHQRIR